MSRLFGPEKQDSHWPKFSDVREKELRKEFPDALIKELRRLRAEYLHEYKQGPVTQLLSDSKAVAQVDKDLKRALRSLRRLRGFSVLQYDEIKFSIEKGLLDCKYKGSKKSPGRPKGDLKKRVAKRVELLFKSHNKKFVMTSDHHVGARQTPANLAVRAVLGLPRTMRVSHLKPAPEMR